jgi:hypothetical protein
MPINGTPSSISTPQQYHLTCHTLLKRLHGMSMMRLKHHVSGTAAAGSRHQR